MKKISWVLLTWNSEVYIENCLRSIEELTAFENDVIVVDNGSQDHTRELIRKFRVKLIELPENKGTTYPRNLGLKHRDPDSDYICILDSDTVVNEAAVKTMAQTLDSQEKAAIAGPAMRNKKGEFQVSFKHFPTVPIKFLKGMPVKAMNRKGEQLESYPQGQGREPFPVDYLISACWLMKPETVEAIGPLDEKIFYAPEDVDYCIRAWKAGYEVWYCPAAQIIHDTQRISKKKLVSKTNFSHIGGLAYYFRKHRYLFRSEKAVRSGKK